VAGQTSVGGTYAHRRCRSCGRPATGSQATSPTSRHKHGLQQPMTTKAPVQSTSDPHQCPAHGKSEKCGQDTSESDDDRLRLKFNDRFAVGAYPFRAKRRPRVIHDVTFTASEDPMATRASIAKHNTAQRSGPRQDSPGHTWHSSTNGVPPTFMGRYLSRPYRTGEWSPDALCPRRDAGSLAAKRLSRTPGHRPQRP